MYYNTRTRASIKLQGWATSGRQLLGAPRSNHPSSWFARTAEWPPRDLHADRTAPVCAGRARGRRDDKIARGHNRPRTPACRRRAKWTEACTYSSPRRANNYDTRAEMWRPVAAACERTGDGDVSRPPSYTAINFKKPTPSRRHPPPVPASLLPSLKRAYYAVYACGFGPFAVASFELCER